MIKIQTLNKISPMGLELFPREKYEIASEVPNPDAVLVRSANMLEMTMPSAVKAIARAGAGYNNIPVDSCTQKGIVVFNTPGANANGVKELAIASLLLCSRRVIPGIEWTKSLAGKGEEVSKIIEKEKSNYVGPEIKGKKLAVIGLGAIGVMVANDAQALEMEVIGFDPFISLENAWCLSRNVRRALSLNSILAEADYITLHLPLEDSTKGMINAEKFALMKKGVRIINLARGGLVNNKDLIKAIKDGIVSTYVTDFATDELIKTENVICYPHLGASTPESEDNCAFMAVKQLRDYLEYGNIKNSVNFPACEMALSPKMHRFIMASKNISTIVNQVTALLAQSGINIAEMINKHRENIAYSIFDVSGQIPGDLIEKVKALEGVMMVRAL